MKPSDTSFMPHEDLLKAVAFLHVSDFEPKCLPQSFPHEGLGDTSAMELLAPHVLGKATRLDDALTLAHMDPPTPWITWAMALWNARLNQNLLHPALSPFAHEAETFVIDWLAPYFGMQGGHMCSGSTLANLTAIWAARDIAKVKKVIASEAAHISIAKAAHILGLAYETVPTDSSGAMDVSKLGDLSDACLVLTAGTTTLGAIDSLEQAGKSAWTHVDAAWAGALRLSSVHASLLEGIERADSVALSAHKWFFQPKDSAMVFFKEIHTAHEALSFGSSYLATPNVGIQGSRSASAIALLATLLAWGKKGLEYRIVGTMHIAETLAEAIAHDSRLDVCASGKTGINVFRPLHVETQTLFERLPKGMFSTCHFNQNVWVRSVCANPLADVNAILEALDESLK